MKLSEQTIAVCCMVGIAIILVGCMLFSFGMWFCNEGHLMTAIYLWFGAQICGFVGIGLIVPTQAIKNDEDTNV